LVFNWVYHITGYILEIYWGYGSALMDSEADTMEISLRDR
jgi:hypothetical protein